MPSFQKSIIDFDLYGKLKLIGNLRPNNKPRPTAISE